jgi:hypothetical protein
MDRMLAGAAADLKYAAAALQQRTQCSKNRLSVAFAGGGKWFVRHLECLARVSVYALVIRCGAASARGSYTNWRLFPTPMKPAK